MHLKSNLKQEPQKEEKPFQNNNETYFPNPGILPTVPVQRKMCYHFRGLIFQQHGSDRNTDHDTKKLNYSTLKQILRLLFNIH
jgi:hypothetical protein